MISKKGKTLKKNSTPMATADHESDWTSGDNGPSVKDMFTNMTAMMASLSTHMGEMEGRGRKKGKVVFHVNPPAWRTLAPAPEMASQPDAAPATMTSLPPPRPQPHSSQERLAPSSSRNQLPSLPVVHHEGLQVPYQDVAPPRLPEVSEAVRARVAQCLQGAPAQFLLRDEDSPTDDEASPIKR